MKKTLQQQIKVMEAAAKGAPIGYRPAGYPDSMPYMPDPEPVWDWSLLDYTVLGPLEKKPKVYIQTIYLRDNVYKFTHPYDKHVEGNPVARRYLSSAPGMLGFAGIRYEDQLDGVFASSLRCVQTQLHTESRPAVPVAVRFIF